MGPGGQGVAEYEMDRGTAHAVRGLRRGRYWERGGGGQGLRGGKGGGGGLRGGKGARGGFEGGGGGRGGFEGGGGGRGGFEGGQGGEGRV